MVTNNKYSYMPIQQLFIATVDSTNNYLRRKLDEGYKAEGMLIVSTDNQTAGRGQRGNSWESEPGKNLMFSILTHPSVVPASRQFIISQAMALAILHVLKSISPLHSQRFTVKWPNDIYYDNSKLGGTLIECDLQGKNIDNCIIGTGLNVNQTRFVSDAPNPISLKQIFGREFDRDVLLSAIIKEFADIYSQLTDGQATAVREEYTANLYRREGFHPYADAHGTFHARIAGIEESGHLLLLDDEGITRRYEFKEVRFT